MLKASARYLTSYTSGLVSDGSERASEYIYTICLNTWSWPVHPPSTDVFRLRVCELTFTDL